MAVARLMHQYMQLWYIVIPDFVRLTLFSRYNILGWIISRVFNETTCCLPNINCFGYLLRWNYCFTLYFHTAVVSYTWICSDQSKRIVEGKSKFPLNLYHDGALIFTTNPIIEQDKVFLCRFPRTGQSHLFIWIHKYSTSFFIFAIHNIIHGPSEANFTERKL